MIIINNISNTKFTYNGVPYLKNFTPIVRGDKIEINNTYGGVGLSLTNYTPIIYSQFIIDGVTYNNVNDTQDALLPVIFTRASLGGGSVNPQDLLSDEPGQYSYIDSTDKIYTPTPTSTGGGLISPFDYLGTDTQRIQAAINAASSTKKPMEIPMKDSSNTPWMLDDALLLKSDLIMYINGAILKPNDTMRDNVFRTENCGLGITAPFTRLKNINIIGLAGARIEGADNPRATGDNGKTLGNPAIGGQSFGTDAGVAGETQTGDWRNYFVIFAYTDNYSFSGVHFENSNSYCITNERCTNGRFENLTCNLPRTRVGANQVLNTNLIDIRMGCDNITVDGVQGFSDDDIVATVIFNPNEPAGQYGTYTVTGNTYAGEEDDISNISFRNISGSTKNNIVRVFNPSGTKTYNVNIQNITDTGTTNTTVGAVVKVGDANFGGASQIGECYNITVDNVKNVTMPYVLEIGGSMSESIVSNCTDLSDVNTNYPINYGSGNGVRNLYLNNVTKGNAFVDFAATVTTVGGNNIKQGIYMVDDAIQFTESSRNVSGRLMIQHPGTPRPVNRIWSGSDAQYGGVTPVEGDLYVTETGIQRASAPTPPSVLFEDLFAGTTIDPIKWTVTNPNTTKVEFTQNNNLIVEEKGTGNAAFGADNMFGATAWDISTQELFMTFDVTNLNQNQNVWIIGMSNQASHVSYDNRFGFFRNSTSNTVGINIIRAGATDFSLTPSLNINSITRLGIGVTDTTITFYNWNGSAWNILGSSANTYGSLTFAPIILNIGGITANNVTYGRMYVASAFHSTEIPQ